MEEEKARQARQRREELAATSGEALGAVARRTHAVGMAALRAAGIAPAVVRAMRGLDCVRRADEGLGRVAPWAVATMRCAAAVARAEPIAYPGPRRNRPLRKYPRRGAASGGIPARALWPPPRNIHDPASKEDLHVAGRGGAATPRNTLFSRSLAGATSRVCEWDGRSGS